jgi:hypothetical protein
MRIQIAALAVGLALGGSTACIANRLGQRAMNQANTPPELHYRRVLDNLARFADNPSARPWHVNVREGTTQVTDSGSAGRPSTSARRPSRCRSSSARGPSSSGA